MKKFFTVLLLCAFGLSGCSHFSKSSRQQRAYEKYVRKSSITRVKQQRKFHSDKPQMPTTPMQPSEPMQSTESGPQSVSPEG